MPAFVFVEDSTPQSAATRFRGVAGRFTEVAAGVSPDQWNNPTPCTGWVARDVVSHLVEWVPAFLAEGAGLQFAEMPSVADDPAAAWAVLNRELQNVLDDPTTVNHEFNHPRAGTHPLDRAIVGFILGDVLVHTWDLARATGQDETLDATEVRRMREGLETLGDALSKSGHYNVPVTVPADADEQTRMLALTGRNP